MSITHLFCLWGSGRCLILTRKKGKIFYNSSFNALKYSILCIHLQYIVIWRPKLLFFYLFRLCLGHIFSGPAETNSRCSSQSRVHVLRTSMRLWEFWKKVQTCSKGSCCFDRQTMTLWRWRLCHLHYKQSVASRVFKVHCSSVFGASEPMTKEKVSQTTFKW